MAINIFNHSNNKEIQNAPVKGQCAKAYFYGRDLRLEKLFQSFEGQYASITTKLMEGATELNPDELLFLKEFAYLQFSRTDANVKRRALTRIGLDELTHKGVEQYRKEIPDTSHEEMLLSVMESYAGTRHTIEDLEVALLENKTNYDFITSDDPAILTNRLCLQRLGGRATGTASSGVQFVMPLTPRLYLICYDRDVYIAPNKKGFLIAVHKKSDIEALNELQFIRCENNVYFRNWNDLNRIKKSFSLAQPRRPQSWINFWSGIQTHTANGYEYFRKANTSELASSGHRIISYNSVLIQPSKWISCLPSCNENSFSDSFAGPSSFQPPA